MITSDVGGARLSASVSPCSWMYPNYGLQITVQMAGGGNTIVHDKTVPYASATEQDMVRLLNTVKVKKCRCRGCSNIAFDPTSTRTNRDSQCEACFLRKLYADVAKETARENATLAKLDAQYLAKGCTHRVDMWVHASGDDKLIRIWMENATDAKVKAELKKMRSRVLNDYTITPLTFQAPWKPHHVLRDYPNDPDPKLAVS